MLVALLVSRLNPLLNVAANNNLETQCPTRAAEHGEHDWVVDRSSWTPLLWHCDVTDDNGDTHRIDWWWPQS